MFMSHLLALLAFAGQLHAVTLPAFPDAPSARLPINKDAPAYTCDQIPDKLAEYNTMARQHDQSISSFLGQVVDKLNGWYSLLSPLEGSAAAIDPGTFTPLQDGATQISNLTDLAFDNSELLANEMDRIIVSLRQCAIRPLSK